MDRLRGATTTTHLSERRAAEREELEPLDVAAEVADAHQLVVLLLRQRDVLPLLLDQAQRHHLLRPQLTPTHGGLMVE